MVVWSGEDEHVLKVRVYLEDTDAGGIVYHASYLRFMERARTEYLRALGLEQSRTFEDDASFVVHSMQLRFLRGARLDDELAISCRLIEARAASVKFAQLVTLVGEDTRCVEADVTVACISLANGRARRIPDELRRMLVVR